MSLESGYVATLIVHRPEGDLRMVFQKWSDGGVDSPDTKGRNPVTRRETARGGLRTRSNVTLTRECDAQTWAQIPLLEDSAGKDLCTAIRQMVGPRNEAIGAPKTVTGMFKSSSPPDYDLDGDGIGMLEIEISANEV